MKVMLFYPPGEMFQRGEDRCQISVKSSTANAMRACNDLGYMASVLRTFDDKIFLRDYATEEKSYCDYIDDIKGFDPDVLVLSTTNTTIFTDIELINKTFHESAFDGMVILKGAIFFDASQMLLNILDLTHIDILVGGEIDGVIGDIIHKTKPYSEINGILYKTGGQWHKTDFDHYNDDLDDIPFPARDLMPNELYIRPDTGEPMATIQTSRGCPSGCIYCLSPQISGKRIRYRSPQNVLLELEECYHKYHIRNFFFRADTFTFKKEWVLELCDLIKNSDLYGKIEYTANSRVKPLSIEVLQAMKDTGCFMIAFGFETGSKDTMEKIRKGVTVEDNYRAVRMAKKVGIPVLGFFMMGFPWETRHHLKDTKRMLFNLDCDFIEVHVALPFYGTTLYEICKEEGVLAENVLGMDIFHASTKGTKYVSSKELMNFRNHTLLQFYLRPKYIWRKLLSCKNNPKVFMNYMKYGFRLIGNLVFKA